MIFFYSEKMENLALTMKDIVALTLNYGLIKEVLLCAPITLNTYKFKQKKMID